MSSPDDPFGAFNRDRTIIRPNPAGRRPEPPRPPPSVSPANTGASDEWIASHERDSDPEPIAPLPQIRANELVAPHDNPIMRAAGPLLLLLGRLRVKLLRASFASLMEEVAEAVKFFEKDIREAGIPEDQANTAKYCLCATADDIVQNIPTEDRHVWTQYSMLSRFFGERQGGVRFFDELDRAKMDPLRNYPVLELQYSCLALGFQGVQRTLPTGAITLQKIQRELYEILRRIKPRVEQDLSPRWQGQALAHMKSRFRVPVWAVYGVAAAALFGLYITLRTLLGGTADAATERVATLHSRDAITLERRVPAPPPRLPDPPPDRPSQLQRLRVALAPDIASGLLSIDQSANKVVLRVGAALFASGQATVVPQYATLAQRLAAAVEKEPGAISIVGHTDNVRLTKTSRFQSNWQLSLERAKAVSALMSPGLSQPNRISVDGKGDEVPVATNATPEGRTQNRRVEILLTRTDS